MKCDESDLEDTDVDKKGPQEIINNIDVDSSLKEVAEKQKADPELKQLIDFLTEGILPVDADAAKIILSQAKRDFELVDGVLFHFWYPRPQNPNTNWKKQLCVPKSMQTGFLIEYHDAMGHLGIRKTYDKMASSLYWKTMHADVEKWIKSCIKCNGKKDPKTGNQFPIGTIIPSGEACSEWVVDVLGPLKPTTRHGNKCIVIFIDRFTKWPEAFAVPNQESETIARLLVQEIIPRHGCPRTLLSDRGSPFLSKLSHAVYELLGVKKLNTTAYHPQCNGLVERFNHTVVAMLTMYTNEYPDDWDEHLNYCIWAYRTSTNDTTKHSPFYLLYGREALFPLDAMLESEEKYRSSEEYVAEIIQKLKIAKELVIKSALRIKQKRDDNNAQKNRLKSFNVGEYVMLFQPASKKGISSKLLHKWKGPFTIIAQTSPVNYVIKNVANGRKTDHVHVSRLKSCYRREVAADGLTFTSEAKVDVPAAKTSRKKKNDLNPADEEMGTAFEVSKIVGKGWDEVSPGKWVPRYRVRWKGYGEADDTWESLDNLTGLEGLIETYDALHTDDEETYTDTTAEVNLVAIQLF
jgi:transposase InsO family protein